LLHIVKCEVNYIVRKMQEILFGLTIKYENVYHLVYYLAINLLNLIYENFAYMALIKMVNSFELAELWTHPSTFKIVVTIF
jgi:hypothetical protein